MLSSILGRAFASSTPSSQQTENTTDIDDTQKFPHLIPISERNVVRHPRKHDETVNGSHSSETTGQNEELKMKERDENLLSTTSSLLTDKLRNMPYSTTTPTVKSSPSSCVSPDSTSDDSDVSSQSKTGISSNHSEFVKTHSSNLSTSINSSPQPTTTTSEETVTELQSLIIEEVSQTKDITDDTNLTATEGRGGTIESLNGESPSDIPNDPGKMFIGGLSWITTPESIRSYFSTYGELAEVMVMKDPATRRSRGFGFITFVESGAVEKVMAKTVHTLDGKVIEPKVAVPRKTSHIHTSRNAIKTKKIFVGGISSTTSSDDVKQYFQQFSIVTEVMLAYDKITNRHRGFGFVSFNNDEVVDKICEIHFHEINGKMVESKKALPRDSRFHPMMHPAAAFGMYGFVPPPPHLPPSIHHQIFLPYHPSQNTPPTGAALNQPLCYNNNNTNTTNPFYMGPPFPYHHRFPGGGGSSGAPIPMIPSQYFVAPYAATAGGMAQMSTIGATTTDEEEEEKEDNAHSVEQITDELKHLPIPSDTKEGGDRDTLVDQPDSTTDEKTELSIEKKATSSAVR